MIYQTVRSGMLVGQGIGFAHDQLQAKAHPSKSHPFVLSFVFANHPIG